MELCSEKKNSFLGHFEGLICFYRHLEKSTHNFNKRFMYVFGMLIYTMHFLNHTCSVAMFSYIKLYNKLNFFTV